MKTQAALLRGIKTPLTIETLDLDDPHPGEVRVKIAASGVCHSDYHLITGSTKHPMPVVLGHEGAGIVDSVGEGVSRVKVGDHVALSWVPDCGECFYCLRDMAHLCQTYDAAIWEGRLPDGSTRWTCSGERVYHYAALGTFSEYLVVPQESCVQIRKDVPLKVAALVGCSVATGVGAAWHTAQVRPGDSVVIVGCGGVGLNIIMGAVMCGAGKIIAVDANPVKMDMARDFGATHTLLAGENTLYDIRDLTDGRGADHAFEAVGIPALQETAFAAIRPGGTLTLSGLAPMGTGTNLPGAVITRQEKIIKGSYYGGVNMRRDFPLLLDWYMDGKLPLEKLISQTYTLDQINEAFDTMLSGATARGVILF